MPIATAHQGQLRHMPADKRRAVELLLSREEESSPENHHLPIVYNSPSFRALARIKCQRP
jgi:hypothetical protein